MFTLFNVSAIYKEVQKTRTDANLYQKINFFLKGAQDIPDDLAKAIEDAVDAEYTKFKQYCANNFDIAENTRHS